MRMKTLGLVTMAAALALSTGCSKKATGQVVAVVNGEEISQQELTAELQNANVPPGADKKAVQVQALQRLIDRKLLVQKAKQGGLDRTPEYLLQSRRLEDNLLIQLMASKAGKIVSVPDAATVSQFMATHPTIFGGRKRYQLDQIAFPAPADRSVLKKLEPLHDMDSVAASLTESGVKINHGKTTLDTATIPPEMADRIAALKAGEPFVVPVPGGFVVNVITATDSVPVDEAQARPAAAELVRRQKIEESMKSDVKSARSTAKIEYQSGFAPPAGTDGAAPVSK